MRYLGIDIGTTNTKAVVMDEDQGLVETLTLPLPPHACNDEIDPADWLEQFRQPIRIFRSTGALPTGEWVAGLATQGGSFVGLDANYQPIGPGVSWTAQANAGTTQSLRDTVGLAECYERTGWEPNGWLASAKLKEALRTNRDLRFFAGIAEWIFQQSADVFTTDNTNAQCTGMFDFHNAKWWPDALRWIGLGLKSFPAVQDSAKLIVDNVTVDEDRCTVAGCAHDQYATMFACNLASPGAVVLGTGTAWVINGTSDTPVRDEVNRLVHPGRDILSERFGFIATLGAVGRGFDRLCDSWGIDADELPATMEISSPPAKPIKANLEEGQVGDAADSLTAVRRFMEAAAAKVRFHLETLNRRDLDTIIMTGGAARNRLWGKLLAAICRVRVEAVAFNELTAYGAALLARYATKNLRPSGEWPTTISVERYDPDSPLAEGYNDWYCRHQQPVLQRQLTPCPSERGKTC